MCGGVEKAKAVEVGWRWSRLGTRQRTATPHLLEVAIHGHHPLLHGLYLLHPLLFIPLVVLIQLHVPPVSLLELPLPKFIQCMDLVTDVLRTDPSRPALNTELGEYDLL